MNCPKCEGKVHCIDTVQTMDNETYRRKKCLDCGRIFYTCEYMVSLNGEFMDKWRESHRAYPRRGILDAKYAHWQTSTDPDDRKSLNIACCSSCGHVITIGRKSLPYICPGCEAIMD